MRTRQLFTVSAAMASSLICAVAVAQEGAPALAQNDSSAPVVLDEVIVRGHRVRASTTTDLSSKTKVTGERAEDLGLRDLRDTLKVQGNTFVAPSNNGNNGISIRGINSEGVGEPGANSRPLSTLIIDGAPQSIEGVRRGQRGTWDIASVEVVRGPQTTLTGRNTLAGSIALQTNDPTDDWEAAARIAGGEYDQFRPALMVSGPLSEQLAFRVAAESSRGNKGIRYSDPAAAHLDNDEYRNVRGKLRYRPLDQLELKLTVSDTHDDPSVTAVSGPDYGKRYFNVRETAAERRRNDVRNNVLDVKYEFEPGVALISTTAYVTTDANIDGTGSFQSAPYMRDEIRADRDSSQLLRYVHAPDGAKVGGEAGMFVGRFVNTRDSLVTVGPVVQQDLDAHRRDRNAAVFGESFWTFVPRWRVIGGVRYEYERTEQTVDYRSDGIRQRSDYDNDVVLPKVGIVHELNASDSIGATVATGYRGGFRETEAVDTTGGHDVDPEFMTNLDIAYRSSWFDDSVDISANVFYNRWRDQQVSVNLAKYESGDGNVGSASVLTKTINAGESHSYGAEFNADWQITDRINVGTSIGYLQTRFDDLPLQDINLRGNEFPEAPRLSGGLWLVARFARGWFFSSDVSARGSAYATSDIWNDEDKKIPGYGLTNLRIGHEGDMFSTVFSINNLFDKEYLSGRDFRDGYYVGDPRLAEISVTARFY